MAHSLKMLKSAGDQRGFTLLEVLMAMVIATVGLLGLALMQGNAVTGNSTGSKLSQATFLAQDMLEQIKDGNLVPEGTFGYIDMDYFDDTKPIVDVGPTAVDAKGAPGGPFDLSYTVEGNTDWSRRITVSVVWDGAMGIKRRVELMSLSRGDGN